MAITKEKLLAWNAMQMRLKELKESEMSLRKEIVNEIVGKTSVAVKKEIVVGSIEVTAKFKTSVSIADKNEVEEDYDDIPEYIRNCFPKKISFSQTEYNKLTKEQKEEVDDYLIEKPAAPDLSIKIL